MHVFFFTHTVTHSDAALQLCSHELTSVHAATRSILKSCACAPVQSNFSVVSIMTAGYRYQMWPSQTNPTQGAVARWGKESKTH